MKTIPRLLLLATALAACAAPLSTNAPAPVSSRPVAAGIAPPTGYRYPGHDTVRVVTWNVEHFVDPFDSPYVDAERENQPARSMESGKIEGFVAAIRTLDADVVVLQEFESEAYLEVLARERFPDLGYRFFAGTESPTWYQNVVVMSRLPLGVLRSYANVTTPVEGIADSLGRPETQSLVNNRMWLVDVLARPDYAFSLAGLHLKAGRSARDVGFRTGQIRLLHLELARLLRERPGANVLVAGDLNSVPGSPELALLLGPSGGPVALIDPFRDRPAPTHPSDRPTRQLDHLLPNAGMFAEMVADSARVATPLPIDEMVRVSDHLPVIATFLARDR